MMLASAFLAAAGLPVRAQDVRVIKEAAGRASLDMRGLEADTPAGQELTGALRAALLRSSWFAEASPGAAEFRLSGSAQERRGQMRFECEVRAGTRGVFSRAYQGEPAHARALAHRAADDIVEALTGRPGFASSRLALVGDRTGHKELYLAGSDGRGLQQVTRDGSISLYPRWSPDSRRLVYTAYLQGFPDVFQIELNTGERRRISAFPGLNSGAAFSPDGRSMTLVLSKDGNPELYVRDLQSGALTRLTRTPRAAEASPSWSPDGRRIVYVSDASGAPHLYLVGRDGSGARRLTSRGRECVAPDWGPGGQIVYSKRIGDGYGLAVIDPDTQQGQTLSRLPRGDWEDPTWARDGRHVAAVHRVGRRSSIWLVDTATEEAVVLLSTGEGNWFSPAWSP